MTTEVQQRERLAETEERFRLTVANAPIGIALVSLEGMFLQVNKELERILGRSADELARLRFHEVTYPDDLAADVALVEALLADDIPNYQMDKRYQHSDGSTVWTRLTVSLVRTPAGEPRYFVSQIEDISEVRAAQAQLERRALYDPLTGLANRSLLLDRLSQSLRQHAADGGPSPWCSATSTSSSGSTTRSGKLAATSCCWRWPPDHSGSAARRHGGTGGR